MYDIYSMGEGMVLPFSLEEYDGRLKKIRHQMANKGVDILYLTMPESMYYVSGLNMVWYATRSSSLWDGTKNMGIAINVNEDDFILFATAIEEDLVRYATCAKEVRIKGENGTTAMNGKTYIGPNIDLGETMNDLIIKDLKDMGWLNGVVALELGSDRPPARVSLEFQSKLKSAGCKIVDGTDIVSSIRTIKSPMEQYYIKKAAVIADKGMEAIKDEYVPGMTELDIVGIYTKSMMACGGEMSGITEMVRSGEGKIWCGHSPASRRVIMHGEPIAVDIGGVYHRYNADLGRFFYTGEPPSNYAKLYHTGNVKVIAEVKKLLKPKTKVEDFCKDLIEIYKDLGLWDNQCYAGGYDMGIAFPPDWCGQFVFDITTKDNYEKYFEPGMVINFETGMGAIDTVIFTEHEAQFLSNLTHDLIIL